MYSEFKSFSIMGVSNSEMFLSAEKDLLEIKFLAAARPTLQFDQDDDDDGDECEIAPFLEGEGEGDDHHLYQKREDDEDHRIQHDDEDQEQEKEAEEDNKFKFLKIKLPSPGEFKVVEKEEEEEEHDDDSDGGFKTPTSLDQKIPAVLQCPPAPRKPKTLPLTKRKELPDHHQWRILHDLSNEIEALFPPALLADLGNKIKKVRRETTDCVENVVT